MKSRFLATLGMTPGAAIALAALLLALPVGAQQAAELVELEGQPTLLFRAGHQHKTLPKFTWCFGNLYVSRNAIRYEVTDAEGGGNAARYREHGFSASRTQFAGAKRWYNGVEIRLIQGKPYHLHIYQAGSRAVGRDRFIQPEPLLEALNDFEAALARAQPVAPPTAVAAPAPPSASPAATLTVVTHPGKAQVYLNNEVKGETGSDGVLRLAELPPGDYRIRLALAGHKEWSQEIKLEAEEKRSLEVTLVPEPQASQAVSPLSLEQVLKLLEGGVSTVRITALVIERGVDFPLTNENEKRLREAGASAELLLEITKAKK